MDNNKQMILTEDTAQLLPAIIQQMMGPVIESMAQMLEHNTKALNQLAAAQQVQSDRMAALERQIRLNTLVTPQQVKYFNDAIRNRARELLIKRDIDDRKAVQKLGGLIRKSVLARYGVGALHDIPKHEYSVVMNHIGAWNDMLCVRDVMKEARDRHEAGIEAVQPPTTGVQTGGTTGQSTRPSCAQARSGKGD